MSKLQTRQHIEIDLSMDELDLTVAEKMATYQEFKNYVKKQTGSTVFSSYKLKWSRIVVLLSADIIFNLDQYTPKKE